MQLGLQEVVAVVEDFLARLDADRNQLNALNVFPVADNDTGNNMVSTVEAILSALDGVGSFAVAAESVETAALEGRGNSGLIIGQFLAGFFSSFDREVIDLGAGISEGAQWARRAVAAPVEGTILTVADAAASLLASQPEIAVAALSAAVDEAVDATPSQLAVLADRGVVDSGAAGLAMFFLALESAGTETAKVRPRSHDRDELIRCDVGLGTAEPLGGVYEVQFRVPAAVVSADELKQLLLDLGSDVVVASAASELAAHVHVADPHTATAAISKAIEVRAGAKAISYQVERIIEPGPTDETGPAA